MDTSKLTAKEATREIERLTYELVGLRESKKKPNRQTELVVEIEQLGKLLSIDQKLNTAGTHSHG